MHQEAKAVTKDLRYGTACRGEFAELLTAWGAFGEALRTLDGAMTDSFIPSMLNCVTILHPADPEARLDILVRVARVLAWTRPNWGWIAELLTPHYPGLCSCRD